MLQMLRNWCVWIANRFHGSELRAILPRLLCGFGTQNIVRFVVDCLKLEVHNAKFTIGDFTI